MSNNKEMILSVFGSYTVGQLKIFAKESIDRDTNVSMDKLAGTLYGAWQIAQTLAEKEKT